MDESPAKRFRRIVDEWREEEKQRQSSLTGASPDGPHRAAPPAPVTREPPPEPPRPAPKAPTDTAPPASMPPPDIAGSEAPPAEPPSAAPDDQLVGTEQESDSPPSAVEIPSFDPASGLDKLKTPADARRFLERLRDKTTQTVQDFTSGAINQRQFEAVYSHYQRQRMAVEKALIEMPGSGAWRAAAVEGLTSFLRQQHAAQVLSYALYKTINGAQLTSVGDFDMDDSSVQPMLDQFRSGQHKLFGPGTLQMELEGGRWVCVMPGRFTTLIIIFSAEPAMIQLDSVEDAHRDFEAVNETSLAGGDTRDLTFTFTHLWDFEPGFFDA